MFSSLATHRTSLRSRSTISATLILLGAILVSLLATGCGGDKADNDFSKYEDNSAVLAKVGNGEITAKYYEERLSKMTAEELPKLDGVTLDMDADAGKLAFLDVLINKELMNQKALKLGYNLDPAVVGARLNIIQYEAGLAMWNDVVMDVTSTISEEELQEFYANMGTEYKCNYVICNLEADALKAREFALTGADWEDVVNKYHDGSRSVTSKYELAVPFGQYSAEFEDKIFETELGGVSQPIISSYGYWVVRVVEINHGDKPDLEAAKAQILDVTRNRKIGATRLQFKRDMRVKYEFLVNQDALWVAYQGLPENGLMDPETKQPYTKDKLEDLDVRTQDLGLVFYSYRGKDGQLVESTVADYKTHFDRMSVFQRPKKEEMLGGLRQKIEGEIDKGILNIEAEKRGYFERPDVVAIADKKIEEIMVTRLYKEAVLFDDKITPEQLDEFWAEHKDEYIVPETRSGHLVICLTREKADAAYKAIIDGVAWRKILVDYGSDANNKKRGGKTESVNKDSASPLAAQFFALEPGGVSQPFSVNMGQYAVVQLDFIKPSKMYEMHEVTEALGGRIRNNRREAAFVSTLDEWREEIGVEIFEENLTELKSWDKLTEVIIPDNLVPRN